jgi:hypothetical protein
MLYLGLQIVVLKRLSYELSAWGKFRGFKPVKSFDLLNLGKSLIQYKGVFDFCIFYLTFLILVLYYE